MELDDFREDLIQTVKSAAAVDGGFTVAAFVEEAARRLAEAEEIADFQPGFAKGTGSRRRSFRVDGYCEDDLDGSMSLLVADFRGNDQVESITLTDASALFGQLSTFIEDSIVGKLHPTLEESSPGFSLSLRIYEKGTAITKFRLYLVTDAQTSSRIKELKEDAVAGIPTIYSIWDISRFLRLHDSKTGKEDIEVDFTSYIKKGVPCLNAHVDATEHRSYLCVLPGALLADVYERYGSRLLEQNVRSFLSARGQVNKGIRNTILKESAMFFAYNNGITATAIDITVEEDNHGRMMLKLARNLQIVNGGQTTASLLNARKKDKADLKKIFVQMKLSVVPPEKAEDIIPRISRYANSQNKVTEADFFANHPFHWRMEEISRRIYAPAVGGVQHETRWFYERARGQYVNEAAKGTAAQQKRFGKLNPKDHVITKTDLAKFENSWRCLPHKVSLGAQKNFREFADHIGKDWELREPTFNEIYYKKAVVKAIIFRETERIVSEQPWYDGGYRAQIVTYTVAKLSTMIAEKGMRLDFSAVWSAQELDKPLVKQITTITRAVNGVITSPEAGFQNVTEWSKKELCWKRVEELNLALTAEVSKLLVSQAADAAAMVRGKKLQVIDNGIEAQSQVVELGAEFWKKVKEWTDAHCHLTDSENTLLRVACRIPEAIPDDKQSRKLLELRKTVEDDGCPDYEQQ